MNPKHFPLELLNQEQGQVDILDFSPCVFQLSIVHSFMIVYSLHDLVLWSDCPFSCILSDVCDIPDVPNKVLNSVLKKKTKQKASRGEGMGGALKISLTDISSE